ncbi:uncharacterized protein [Venturia canescens]|uniref:uncharacterized protein n=1 Tax=Venturia canescens TaxID=32260 RepID=UPI001C9BFBF6|nr:uncharacterized protein LOC122416217 [Venturia canescens]
MIVHGKGLVNSLINNLPVELHLPGYQYCGPGTKLAKRLARGDPGINPLDAACKQHDIAYSKNRDNLEARHLADKVLAEQAWKRVTSKDASLGERASAWAVTNIMKTKRKFGLGMKRPKSVCLKKIIGAAKKAMIRSDDSRKVVMSALKGARAGVKGVKVRTPRILPVPQKTGGLLPFLVPIFAGLSAVGALSGGSAAIVKALNSGPGNVRTPINCNNYRCTVDNSNQ